MKKQIACFALVAALVLSALGCSSSVKTVDAQADMSHSIGLTGVSNARDIGGYKTTDGKTVKTGMLLRSGALYKATDDDKKILLDTYHLKQIIDFRTDAEITSQPDPELAGVNNVHVQVIRSTSMSTASAPASAAPSSAAPSPSGDAVDTLIASVKAIGDVNAYMTKSYPSMVTDDYSVNAYKQFFEIVSSKHDGAILYHCSAGKDRAGIASMLLLSALGVDRNTAISDYVLTNDFVKSSVDAMVSAAAQKGADQTVQENIRLLNGVDQKWADAVFDTINNQYGSMDNFLQQKLGLTQDKLSQLKQMYLQ
jgi:Protein tyrosine/serine phosphatase